MPRDLALDLSTPARSADKGEILFLAQMPPPLHGQSAIAAAVYRALASQSGHRMVHRWGGGAPSLADVGRRTAGKYLAFARLLLGIVGDAALGRRYAAAYLGMAPWAHTALRDALLAGVAKLAARRVWVHVHGNGLDQILAGSGLRNRLLRGLLSGTELIAITNDLKRVAEASGVFSRVTLLANMARDPGPRQLTVELPLTIACLGNLDPRKGVLDFVAIVAGLARQGLPVRGLVLGGGTSALSLAELTRAIAAKGAEGAVEAVGPVDEEQKAAILARTDIFLYLSRHDLAPVALIEAMAHGASPIVLDVGGIREMVGPALRDNVLDPADAPEKTAAHVEAIVTGYLEDGARLLADKTRARERYCQMYSPVRFAERVRALVAGR